MCVRVCARAHTHVRNYISKLIDLQLCDVVLLCLLSCMLFKYMPFDTVLLI